MIGFGDGALKRLGRRLTSFPREFDTAREQVLDRYGERLLHETIRRASGRPGPRIITGQYVSSFALRKSPGDRRVVNDSPQAKRLEYGFIGTDSLGRNYNQPAYPHFRPALMAVKEEFKREFRALPLKVWKDIS